MKDITIPELPELVFEEEGHIYRLNGFEIPSVSAVMEPLSAARYKGISQLTLDQAAARGTAVHSAIEDYIKFEIEDYPAEYEGYFAGFLEWMGKTGAVPVASEMRIYHKIMRYAGTVDLLATINGELTLVDFKTTQTINSSAGIQLAAYEHALETHGIEVRHKHILRLKKDGGYEAREFPAKDIKSWQVFAALKTVYDYIHDPQA